jgi:hypothetical protein
MRARETILITQDGLLSSTPGKKNEIADFLFLERGNPDNPVVALSKLSLKRFNKYRVWKPLGLLVLAELTPQEGEVEVIDSCPRHYGEKCVTTVDAKNLMMITEIPPTSQTKHFERRQTPETKTT